MRDTEHKTTFPLLGSYPHSEKPDLFWKPIKLSRTNLRNRFTVLTGCASGGQCLGLCHYVRTMQEPHWDTTFVSTIFSIPEWDGQPPTNHLQAFGIFFSNATGYLKDMSSICPDFSPSSQTNSSRYRIPVPEWVCCMGKSVLRIALLFLLLFGGKELWLWVEYEKR